MHRLTILFALAVAACTPSAEDCAPDDDTRDRLVEAWPDADGDGFTGPAETICVGEALPTGWSDAATALDCDDDAGGVFPGAPEVPADGVDQDCDGADGDASTADVVYVDSSAAACQDDAPGTQATPNCTMENGARLLRPGGTMHVAGGDYGFERILTGRTYVGGYDPATWTLDRAGHPSVVRQPPPENETGGLAAGALGLMGDDAAIGGTVVEGFTLVGAPTSGLSFAFIGMGGALPTTLRAMQLLAGGHEAASTPGTPTYSAGVWGLGGTLVVEDSLVDGGGASDECSGFKVLNADIVVRNTEIVGCARAEHGFGLLVSGGQLVAEDTEIRQEAQGVEYVGVAVRDAAQVFLAGTVVRAGNEAITTLGLEVDGATARAEVKNSAFFGAEDGADTSRGGLVDGGGVLIAANTLFLGGSSAADAAAAVEVREGTVVLVNSLLGSGRSLDGSTATAVRSGSLSDVTLVANDLWDNDADAAIDDQGQLVPDDDVDGCGWSGCVEARLNLARDPGYLDLAAGNFELAADSVCVDAGVDPTPYGLVVDRDIVGRPAPSDGDGDDVAAWDMGPHER